MDSVREQFDESKDSYKEWKRNGLKFVLKILHWRFRAGCQARSWSELFVCSRLKTEFAYRNICKSDPHRNLHKFKRTNQWNCLCEQSTHFLFALIARGIIYPLRNRHSLCQHQQKKLANPKFNFKRTIIAVWGTKVLQNIGEQDYDHRRSTVFSILLSQYPADRLG